MSVFLSRCRPDCITVFGREPKAGEALCRFSGSYPLPAMRELWQLQQKAFDESFDNPRLNRRPAHVPPRWIGDLGKSLSCKSSFSIVSRGRII